METHSKDSPRDSSGALAWNRSSFAMDSSKLFASMTIGEDKPFDFLRSLYEGSVAGGVAGVIVEAALYPIDTIKTRLQAAHGGGRIILKDLYSGLAGNLVGSLPASAICVGVYEPIKQTLLTYFPENLSALAHLTAGFIGGAASSLIRVPTEVVKQRMQTGQFTSAPVAVRLIVAKEGFKSLYAGYGSFLLRDLPFDAVQFCLYEQLRIGYKLAARREPNDLETAFIGAFAGAITGAITTPLDVIKTRLMVQGSAKQYKGICDCVQTIVREEGNHVFFKVNEQHEIFGARFDAFWFFVHKSEMKGGDLLKEHFEEIATLHLGTAPRVLWIGIGGSIFFGVLERTKQMLVHRRPPHEKSSSFKQDSNFI